MGSRAGDGGGAGARRVLRRESDGTLYDVDERRHVTLEELTDEVRSGRRFRAYRPSGAPCTNEVLAEILRVAAPVTSAGRDVPGSLSAVLRMVGDGLEAPGAPSHPTASAPSAVASCSSPLEPARDA